MHKELNQKLTFTQVRDILLLKDMRTIKSYVKNGQIPKIAIDEENFTVDAVFLAKEMGVENFDEPFISSQEAHEILELPPGRINESYCKKNGLNYYRLKNSLKIELLFRKSEIESYLSTGLKHLPFEHEKVARLKYFLELRGFLESVADIANFTDEQREIFLAYLSGANLDDISNIYVLSKERIRHILNKTLRRSISKLYFTESWMKALHEAHFLHIEPNKLVQYVNDLQKVKIENQILKERLEVYEPKPFDTIEVKDDLSKLLNTPIEDLDLTVRTYNCLNNNKIQTLGGITKISMSDFLKFRNAGKKSLVELEELLYSKGLSFAK